jgi:putative FmdB family regulatory protein
MPIYEFRCRDCNSKFDTLVRSQDNLSEINCERCSSTNVRRLVSSFAMVGGYDDTYVASEASRGGGGCCGGSCGCSH